MRSYYLLTSIKPEDQQRIFPPPIKLPFSISQLFRLEIKRYDLRVRFTSAGETVRSKSFAKIIFKKPRYTLVVYVYKLYDYSRTLWFEFKMRVV